MFLDIQMPGMTGFDLLEGLEDIPQVIFTTAYDEYALKTFEVNALDYLMKPIAPERLAAAWPGCGPHPGGAGRSGSRREKVFFTRWRTLVGLSGSSISICWSPKAITRASISTMSAR
jgi:DNA-binding LytR/AlgR family response regulator